MLKPFKLLITALLFTQAAAAFAASQDALPLISINHTNPIDIIESPRGENRIPQSSSDYEVKIIWKSKEEIKIKTLLDKFSFEWVRVKKYLLAPRARLNIKIKDKAAGYHVNYQNKIINFQNRAQFSHTEFFVSLYEAKPIGLYLKNEKVADINILPKKLDKPEILIDYTCSRNGITVEGLISEHISVGCQTKRIGRLGREVPMLEIMWISPELIIQDAQDMQPYYAVFLDQKSVVIPVTNKFTGEKKNITIKARVPKRLHRLFTAYGFGASALHTETIDKDGNKLQIHEPIVPALYFYLNYKISDTASIRGFDAAVLKKSKFNNAGIYLGNDFGFSFDNKLYFTTLLGVQYLYFQFDPESPEISEAIFPQGLEFMYRHAFGIPNYIISGGMFLSTTDAIDYENVWIRWGKNYFWELNLISWAKEDIKAKTWGLSIGFPFKGFL